MTHHRNHPIHLAFCLLLSLVLLVFTTIPGSNCATATTTATVNPNDHITLEVVDVNPTYLHLCLTWKDNDNTLAHALELTSYDWTSNGNLENPVKKWYGMQRTSYSAKCWTFSTPSTVKFIYAPTSFRITLQSDTSHKIVAHNLMRDLSKGTYLVNETAIMEDLNGENVQLSKDRPLVHNLTSPPDEVVQAYSAGATYFEPNPPYACQLTNVGTYYTEHYAAIRVQDWMGSQVCGQCLRLCSSSGYSVEVLVVDQCPEGNSCVNYHWLDISPKAFQLLSNDHLNYGVYQVGWRFVQCTRFASKQKMSYKLASWSKNYGFDLQVLNHTMGVRSVSIRQQSSSEWLPVPRTNFNTFGYKGDSLTCPCDLRLESIVGETVIESNAFTQNIDNLVKEPSYIAGSVQFTTSPKVYNPPANEPCFYEAKSTHSEVGNSAHVLTTQRSIWYVLGAVVAVLLTFV